MATRTKGSFSLAGAIEPKMDAPLDARTIVNNLADLTTANSFPYKYIGLTVFVKENLKKYTLIGDDTTVLANWQEEGSGGSEYTAGDGINITDNEISTERMQSSELSDLDLDEAGQPSGVVIDLRGNERVVGTVIESDGAVKTLYQKTIECTIPTTSTDGTDATNYTSVGASIDKVIGYTCMTPDSVPAVSFKSIYCLSSITNSKLKRIAININTNNASSNKNTVSIVNDVLSLSGVKLYVTIQYTKV